MKIIEGTAQEILEYQRNKENKFVVNTIGKAEDLERMRVDRRRKEIIEKGRHWSTNKSSMLKIKDMPQEYITNVMRQLIKTKSVKELLEDEEFQALVVVLGEKICESY